MRGSSQEGDVAHDAGPKTQVPRFLPERTPGLNLPDFQTRQDMSKFLRPLDFFRLFFTVDIVQKMCDWTNDYADSVGEQRKSLYARWTKVDLDEFYRFIGLLMYMSWVRVPRFCQYWSEDTLLNGLWARRFMSVWRYKCLMSFLKVNDVNKENPNDKLTKIRTLNDYIRRKCMKLFQPYQNIAIDERMVKNKGRYGFRQYIRDKPTKWGMKLWVLADSKTGYTYTFDVYLGKTNESSKFGLAYDVVMNLVKSLTNQGYHLFFDNFYTGVQLMKDLVSMGIRACGTMIVNRKGFPINLKDVKQWARKAERGDMRWERDEDLLYVQWNDNKPVTLLSTFHDANTADVAERRSKEGGKFRKLEIKQPQVVKDYNKYMNGVDKSDQLIGKYNTLRKTNKWWKTLFLHFIDIARVNSYILFNEFRKRNPDIPELQRPSHYNQLDFTLELNRQLAGIKDDECVPIKVRKKEVVARHPMKVFLVKNAKERNNCKLCYSRFRKEMKVRYYCATCGEFYCLQPERNCMYEAHPDDESF